MTPRIQHFASRLLTGSASTLALFALLAATALAPQSAQAQTTFDDFNDDDYSNIGEFAGGTDGIGAGFGPGPGTGGDGTGLSVGVNPGSGGGFAGVAIAGDADASSSEYLTFFLATTGVDASNLPLVLEVNLQEDANGDGTYDGATEDEYQANYVLEAGMEYALVQIPLASFSDDNSVNAGADDGFDFSRVINVVYALGNIPAGPEFTLLFDEIGFNERLPVSNEEGSTPRAASLSSAYPNPFVSEAQFELTLEQSEAVSVEVFDLLGRRVALLHDGTLAGQSPHTFRIDGTNWGSGVYLYRVQGETFVETRRVILAK